MTTTKVDIASQALGLCRAGAISSFEDGSNEAEIISMYYPTFIKDIFSRYPWDFATVTRRLNMSTGQLSGNLNAFIIPAEAKRILGVYFDPECEHANKDFREQGGYILSNENELYIKYTVYPDENLWPGYFVHYAIYALADMICIPMTDDDELAAKLHQKAYGSPSEGERGGKFAIAANIDSQQSTNSIIEESPLALARFC